MPRAFLTVCTDEAANAATTINTDFNTTAVAVTPDTTDIAAATSIGFVPSADKQHRN